MAKSMSHRKEIEELRSIKSLIGSPAANQTNPSGSGPDKFQAAPSQAEHKESFIGGVIKSAAGDATQKGAQKGIKANPKASFIDKAQFAVAGARDELLKLIGK